MGRVVCLISPGACLGKTKCTSKYTCILLTVSASYLYIVFLSMEAVVVMNGTKEDRELL